MSPGIKKQLKIYELMEKGYNYEQILNATNITIPTIKKHMASYSPVHYKKLKNEYEKTTKEKADQKEKAKSKSKIDKLNYDEIVKLHNQNYTQEELAKKLKVSVSTLSRFIKLEEAKTGVQLVKFHSNNVKHKLDYEKIKSLKDSGHSHVEIAKIFNVSYATILRFVKENEQEATPKVKPLDSTQLELSCREQPVKDHIQEDKQQIEQQQLVEDELMEEIEEDKIDLMSGQFDKEAEALFQTYEQMFQTFRKMDEIVSNIKVYFNEVGNYNIDQQKALHILESAKNQDELMKASQEIFELRKKRRLAKMEYSLAFKLMNNLKQYRMHTDALLAIGKSLEELIEIYKNPTYTPLEHREPMPENVTFSTDTPLKKDRLNQQEQELDEWQLKLKQISQGE